MMLGSKSLLVLVGLLTISGVALADSNTSQSLADPNTKLNESSVVPKAETAAVQTNAIKSEQPENVKADKIVENTITAVEVVKPGNEQSVVTHPDLEVLEFVLSDNVENREPKNIVDNFNKDKKQGFAFARLSSLKQSDVIFIWLCNGKEQTRFTTSVHASKKWRTFSSVKLKTGEWTVRLVSGDKVVAEKTFTIQ